ncbi:MAG: drug/metabolite transporter (DMT)-like permease [Candidatus Latescibacterota bacterium]
MAWLFPVVLLNFGFGQLFKWSQRRGYSAPIVVTTNYLVLSSALCIFFIFSTPSWPPLSAPALLGGITGLCFIVSMLTMTHALTRINASSTLTSFRLSIIVPIAVGTWVWGEVITPLQTAGIALALGSLCLLTWRRSPTSTDRKSPLVLLVFVLQGICLCCIHWVHHAGLDELRLYVLMFTALTAGILGALFIVWRRLPLVRDALWAGAGIGLFNLVALSVTLTALANIQGTVFFPLSGCGVVILDNLFAQFIWKEPLGRMGIAGAALGAFAMLLIV